MPSHRDRSRSRSPRRRSASPRRRSESPERKLPPGVKPISADDYFLRSTEYRVWLKDTKKKYLDEISGEKARSYFRKFVKAWNRGKLERSIYLLDTSQVSAASQTGYKWSFSKTKGDSEAQAAVRQAVGAATSSSASSSKRMGPTMPSASDMVLARENANDYARADRDYQRKRDKTDARDRVEEMVGPKEVGREGMLEKKKAQREGNAAFKEQKDDGFVAMDEKTLMGGGDSFKERIAQRDAARKRFDEKRNATKSEKYGVPQERVGVIKDKDKATMDMFQQMAKQRFG